MNRFEEALKWLDNKKREDYNMEKMLEGSEFNHQEYQEPEYFKTTENALKFCAMLNFDVMLERLKKEV